MSSLITGTIISVVLGFWLGIFTWPFTPFDHNNFIAYAGYGGALGITLAIPWVLLWLFKYRDDY